MPNAELSSKFRQSLIHTMCGSGHAVIDVWNIEWHLPDGEITDIPIALDTNLPLIMNFVYYAEQKEQFGPHDVMAISSF